MKFESTEWTVLSFLRVKSCEYVTEVDSDFAA